MLVVTPVALAAVFERPVAMFVLAVIVGTAAAVAWIGVALSLIRPGRPD